MPPARVILVVGASGSGKTALVKRLVSDEFLEGSRPTIGLDEQAGSFTITTAEAENHSRLLMLLPNRGMQIELWELGGRELAKRELPRGRQVDGVMICYDIGDRASFQRAAHILMNFVMDKHLADTKTESVARTRDMSSIGFNGQWSRGVISGDKLTWRDGTVPASEAQIQIVDGRKLETTWNGSSYTGELRDDDRIYWSDGDVWTRQKVTRRPTIQLCGTKADGDNGFAISSEELEGFVRANNLGAAACTSAKSGEAVVAAFHDLVAAILEEDLPRSQDLAASIPAHVGEAWSLTCPSSIGHDGPMTCPRGTRPFEPQRGGVAQAFLERVQLADVDRLVEVLDQNGGATATRTLGRCLERGLRHRAVHVWLTVPRTGALLLRRYAPDAPKHPGRWGPTGHGEILCYGSEGDGHAAELSKQAAERVLCEQLGIDRRDLGNIEDWFELEHWFSCSSEDGKCVEIVDIHVAALKGKGLPQLQLRQGEEVDWQFFADIFSDDAKRGGTVFKAEEDYIRAMFRELRTRLVKNDVMNAFGQAAVATLDRDKIRGFPPAGGDFIGGSSIRSVNRLNGSQRLS